MQDESTKGLKSNQIGLRQAVFQGVSYVAPAADIAILLVITAGYAYGSMPLAILLSWFLYFSFVNTNYQFSKHFGSAAGYYGYVSKGLGPMLGFSTALWYIMFQFFSLAAFGLLGFASFLYFVSPALYNLGYIWILFVLIAAGVAFYFGYRGLRLSLNYAMISSIVEIIFLIGMSIVIIAKVGSGNTVTPFTTLPIGNKFSLLFFAMIFSIPLFAGSGTVITLSEETKGSISTIRKSIVISMVILLLALLVPAYALTVGFGVNNMANFATLPDPGILIFKRYGGIAAAAILLILTINSYMSSNISLMSSTSRVIFSLSRDGLLPKSISKLHRKFHSPYMSVLVLEFGGVILSIIPSIFYGPFTGALILFSINIFGLLFTHILSNISLPFYIKKSGMKINIASQIVVPTLSTAFGFVIIYFSAVTSLAEGAPISYGVFIGLIYVLSAFIFAYVYSKLRPDKVSKIASIPEEVI